MGPSPTYHPPKGEECETSVEHGVLLWAEPAVGYCSRRPRPSPMWGGRFVGARAVGPWVGEQKPLGNTPLRGNPSPEMTYLPTLPVVVAGLIRGDGVNPDPLVDDLCRRRIHPYVLAVPFVSLYEVVVYVLEQIRPFRVVQGPLNGLCLWESA